MINTVDQENINHVLARGLSVLKFQPPICMSDWADKYFYLVAESSSIEGQWRTLPFQKGIMDCMGSGDIPVVTLFKPARIGATKCMVAASGYFVAHHHRSQILYQPTDSDARDFVGDEIDPMIRDVPAVSECMLVDPEKRSSGNTKHRKEFVGAVIDIKGGKSARNYRRMTRDVVMYDELDGFDVDVEGEGSPVSLGDIRISTSSFPKSIRGSTPGTEGESLIQASIEDADLTVWRYLPCPDCGIFHRLEWANMHWVGDDPDSVLHACESCGSLVGYEQYQAMDALGKWGSEDGVWLMDDVTFADSGGAYVEPPRHIAFRFWAGYSYFTTWSELVSEFLRANIAKKRGDLSKLKTFVNTRLAELWTEEGTVIDAMPLMDRREDYGPEVPEGALVITAGVDVQIDRVEVETVAWGIGMENWSLEYKVFSGATALAPEVPGTVWAELDKYLRKRFVHENGTVMRIIACCIDSAHSTQSVYKFCARRAGRRIVAIRGYAGAGRKVASPHRKSKKYDATFMPVGVDSCKELLYTALRVESPGPNYCHFPLAYDQKHFKGLTAEKRTSKFVAGRRVSVWVPKRPGIRNEPLDVRNYCRAAIEMLTTLNLDKVKRVMDIKSASAGVAMRAIAGAHRPPAEVQAETQDTPKPVRARKRRRRGTISRGIS